ncbi:MAG TPA: peptidoglycan endopeptidase [Sphingomonadaceae bacterium]|jgi:hypothetical protein|nr:peptidoglycan endopeptidase [Sphingomonadaceae bacterium]
MTEGQRVARAARACLGTRFRPQGRDPATGLDCVGLAGLAFGLGDLPRGYALRGGDPATCRALIEAAGLAPVDPEQTREGDLLLLKAGPGQLHFAVRTDSGFVHADAAARHVIETPGPPVWPVLGAWRAQEQGA